MSQYSKKKNSSSQKDLSSSRVNFPFSRINYQLFIGSIAVVAIGFILMMGTKDIYSFTKITIAPFVVCVGFALGFVAILYRPKNKKTD